MFRIFLIKSSESEVIFLGLPCGGHLGDSMYRRVGANSGGEWGYFSETASCVCVVVSDKGIGRYNNILCVCSYFLQIPGCRDSGRTQAS